jgi:hypothetical protein
MDAHLRRKSLTFAREKPYFEAKLGIIIFIYNFIKPHSTLSRIKTKPARHVRLHYVPELSNRTGL